MCLRHIAVLGVVVEGAARSWRGLPGHGGDCLVMEGAAWSWWGCVVILGCVAWWWLCGDGVVAMEQCWGVERCGGRALEGLVCGYPPTEER